MPHLQIGPHRFLDVRHGITHTILSPTLRIADAAEVADLLAGEHLTWWRSSEASRFRAGERVEHPTTGLVSRWSLTTSTQGRFWIALEVWADSEAVTSSKLLLPRHLHPSLFARQLDGEVTHTVRRAA